MDIVLIAVTGVSLALAAAMGVLLAHMVREDRLRADARVQLLEELAAGGRGADAVRANVLRYSDVPSAPAAQDLPLRADRFRARATPPAQPAGPAVVPLQRTDLFQDDHEPSAWPRRIAVIGSLAAVLALAIFAWTEVRVPSGAPPAAAAEAAASLELLSLRHAREGNTLTVTGLVQNPKGAAALSNVYATVFIFGPGGTFITSGRAPLDFTSLSAGDESPFVVRVPVSGEVSRYRVGFRGPDDRVVGHVDRRTDQIGRSF